MGDLTVLVIDGSSSFWLALSGLSGLILGVFLASAFWYAGRKK